MLDLGKREGTLPGLAVDLGQRERNSWPSSECFLAAATAFSGAAIATLKYLNDGASCKVFARDRVGDCVAGAGTATWTTHPAEDASSVMHCNLVCIGT